MGEDDKISIPKTQSSLPFAALGAVMLVLAGGLVFWKLSKSSPDDVSSQLPAGSALLPAGSADSALEAPRRRPPPPPPQAPPADAAADASGAAPTASAAAGPGAATGAVTAGCSDPCGGDVGEALSQALRGRGGQARDCYNQALEQNPDLAGKVLVKVRVGKNGEACSAAVVSDTLNNPQVKACVLARFRAGRFPNPNGGCVDTQVPLNFTKRNTLPQ